MEDRPVTVPETDEPVLLAISPADVVSELVRPESRILRHPRVRVLIAEDAWPQVVAELMARLGRLCDQWGTVPVEEVEERVSVAIQRLNQRCERVPRSSYAAWEATARRRLRFDTPPPTVATVALALAFAAEIVTHDSAIHGCGIATWTTFAAEAEFDEAPPWYRRFLGGTPPEPVPPEVDVEGAQAVFRLTIGSGHDEEVALAARALGVLLAEQGDVEGARAALQRAIDSGHPDQAPRAARNLGALLAQQGDVEGARAAFQRAIDSGHPDQAPLAARNLGVLLAEQGDVEGARAAFQRVIDSGHSDQAPLAAKDLAVLLANCGDVEGAREAIQWLRDSVGRGGRGRGIGRDDRLVEGESWQERGSGATG
jgi:PIN domain/Tetratricopeptide repeat